MKAYPQRHVYLFPSLVSVGYTVVSFMKVSKHFPLHLFPV